MLRAAARRDGSRRGQRPRALPAEAERVSAALGRGPVGARRAALVAERRPDPRLAVHESGARPPAADRAPLLAVGAAELQRLPVSVPAGGDLQLQPLELPEPLQRMDPLTRGSLFHEIQAQFFRELDARGELPVTAASDRRRARASSMTSSTSAATRWHDELAPAVERVWTDEIAAIRPRPARVARVAGPRRRRVAAEVLRVRVWRGAWRARSRSLHEAVTLPGGFRLQGAIDLIEEHRQTKVLRLTDHKTGRKPDRIDKVIIGGGAVLQPVLYAMAIEAALEQTGVLRPAVLLHVGRQLPCARDPAERTHARGAVSRCCR